MLKEMRADLYNELTEAYRMLQHTALVFNVSVSRKYCCVFPNNYKVYDSSHWNGKIHRALTAWVQQESYWSIKQYLQPKLHDLSFWQAAFLSKSAGVWFD